MCKAAKVLDYGRRVKAMEVTYKSHHIHSVPELNLEMDCWIPNADVSWDEADTKCRQLLTGPIGYFKIIDEAEIYAVEMAKTWIDAESVDDLTHKRSNGEQQPKGESHVQAYFDS
jgi:hypothetical protein